MGSQRYNPYKSGAATGVASPGTGGIRSDVLAGGGGGARPMQDFSRGHAPLVGFRDANQHAVTGTRPPGASGMGAAPGTLPATGMPPPGQPGASPGGVPTDFLSNPLSGYRAAATALGGMDKYQQAGLDYGAGGLAAGYDARAREREAEERANREQALGNIRGDRKTYQDSAIRGGGQNIMKGILEDPDVINGLVEQILLSRQSAAISGGAEADRGRLRKATGGRGGAAVQGLQRIAKDEQAGNLRAQHDVTVSKALENRKSRMDAIRQSLGVNESDQGILGGYRNEENDALAANYELDSPEGLRALFESLGVGGAGGGGAGGGGAGGGGANGLGAAGGNFPGWGGDDGRRLVGGNTRGRVTGNFGGIQLEDPTGQYREGMDYYGAQGRPSGETYRGTQGGGGGGGGFNPQATGGQQDFNPRVSATTAPGGFNPQATGGGGGGFNPGATGGGGGGFNPGATGGGGMTLADMPPEEQQALIAQVVQMMMAGRP